VSLLGRTAEHLARQGSAFAVIGAAALAVHGVARSTRDLDLLVTDRRCLEPDYWAALRAHGADIGVHAGDAADPLAGVVRLQQGGLAPVDVVVGKSRWQAGVLARARPARIEDADVPVARPADLVLLKLYAGGAQDAWDVAQLLAAGEHALVAEVEAGLADLPDDARRLWRRIADAR
jgi:hypothetical protein